MSVIIKLDTICPSVNSAYYFVRSGPRTIKIKTTKGKDFFKYVVEQFSKGEYIKYTGPIEVHLTFTFPDNRRRDIDNYQKLTNDAFTGLLWADDSQIYKLVTVKKIEKGIRTTEIEVMNYEIK